MPLPEVAARLAELQPQWLELQLTLAREFAALDRAAAYVFEGAASIGEYAARLGYDAGAARALADLGRALEQHPELEERIRAKRIPLAQGAALGTLVRVAEAQGPGTLFRPGDDWLVQAERCSLRNLKKKIHARIEEQKHPVPGIVELSVFVTQKTVDDLDRCREIASREAKRELSRDQTVARTIDHYLETKDPERRGKASRRVGPTAERPGSRYVPAEVRRRLESRSEGTCEVRHCEHRIFLEVVHLEPHRAGGDREEKNLALLCGRHHTLLDAGVIRFKGWGEDGRPTFEMDDGGGGANAACVRDGARVRLRPSRGPPDRGRPGRAGPACPSAGLRSRWASPGPADRAGSPP